MDITKAKPGTIVRAHFSRQKYLVISHPVVIQTIQHLIKVVPISERTDNNLCEEQKHLLMPIMRPLEVPFVFTLKIF